MIDLPFAVSTLASSTAYRNFFFSQKRSYAVVGEVLGRCHVGEHTMPLAIVPFILHQGGEGVEVSLNTALE
jgi:hypothetical protein